MNIVKSMSYRVFCEVRVRATSFIFPACGERNLSLAQNDDKLPLPALFDES